MQCFSLKPEILEKAIKQGKYHQRHEQAKARQLKTNAEGFDRWQLYEILKSKNLKLSDKTIEWIEGMNHVELRAALIEYLLSRNRLIS